MSLTSGLVCRVFCVLLCFFAPQEKPKSSESWQRTLARKLPAFGHRNWIVVADSAYPLHSKPGIETIVTGASQLDVLEEVVRQLKEQKHVRPNVYLDAELEFVLDRDARGIARHRNRIRATLGRREIETIRHRDLIKKLDVAADKFNVLILKTDLTLPYTSVFFELDCGYWSIEADERLREAMRKANPKKE